MKRQCFKPKPGYVFNPLKTAIGRNDPCICLSGKKFKLCCLPNLPETVSVEVGRQIARELASPEFMSGAKETM